MALRFFLTNTNSILDQYRHLRNHTRNSSPSLKLDSANKRESTIRALMPWYNGVQGALRPWTDEDSANLPHLLLQSDPYRQQSFMNVRDLQRATDSPFAVFNPWSNHLYPMSANSAWNEGGAHRGFGTGFAEPPNMYGGDYGLSVGALGPTYAVPHHLGGWEGFHDYYTDPW